MTDFFTKFSFDEPLLTRTSISKSSIKQSEREWSLFSFY